jgi:AraC family transcriptional regulator
MADLHVHPLLITDTVSVSDVTCPGAHKHKSAEECATATYLVFPYRGIYLHHVGRQEAVAEANQLLFIN